MLHINELEKRLKSFDNVKNLRFSRCEVILNTAQMIDSHLQTLKANKGKRLYLPFYERLVKLLNILENERENCKQK